MRRKKAPQGRKPTFSGNFIIALAVYQKLASFRHSQQMLAILTSLGIVVPAPSTFAERKAALIAQLILAVKQLCQVQASRQHLDSKKLEVVDFARLGAPSSLGHMAMTTSTTPSFTAFGSMLG